MKKKKFNKTRENTKVGLWDFSPSELCESHWWIRGHCLWFWTVRRFRYPMSPHPHVYLDTCGPWYSNFCFCFTWLTSEKFIDQNRSRRLSAPYLLLQFSLWLFKGWNGYDWFSTNLAVTILIKHLHFRLHLGFKLGGSIFHNQPLWGTFNGGFVHFKCLDLAAE